MVTHEEKIFVTVNALKTGQSIQFTNITITVH